MRSSRTVMPGRGVCCATLAAWPASSFRLATSSDHLVCWLVKKDDYPFVDDQGKESLNFNITITIALVAVAAIGFATACIGVGVVILVVGLPAVGIFDLVMTVMAAIKSNSGEYYRYPINIRMIT